MQTFMPYEDFRKTFECLDYRRLGKQRIEAFQILRCLEGLTSGWKNHPAVKMWRGHEWIGDERFHSSHRSNLLRKDPIYYGKYDWKETPDLPYYWPVIEEKK